MKRIEMKNMIIEKYTDKLGVSWVRMLYKGKHKTEVLMQESEFEKMYGKFD